MRVCDFCKKPMQENYTPYVAYVVRTKRNHGNVYDGIFRLIDAIKDGLKGHREQKIYSAEGIEMCPDCWEKYHNLIREEVLPKMKEANHE